MIIDCDPGLDDAIAIILAAKWSNIVAITTVAGNVSLEHTTLNALGLCQLLDLDVPVCAGASTSMSPEQPNASHVHGENGMANLELPIDRRNTSSQSAVECLLSHSNRNVWIVAIGPLTNIARTLQADPTWVDRVAGLCLMGGSTVGGNATAAAEFNVFRDYEAAKIVFDSKLQITMCGLNLTSQFRVDRNDVDNLKSERSLNKVTEFAANILDYYLDRIVELSAEPDGSLHDPCAIFALTHPQYFVFRNRRVQVETKGEFTRGMTIVDERNPAQNDESTNRVRVGYQLNEAALRQLLIETLKHF